MVVVVAATVAVAAVEVGDMAVVGGTNSLPMQDVRNAGYFDRPVHHRAQSRPEKGRGDARRPCPPCPASRIEPSPFPTLGAPIVGASPVSRPTEKKPWCGSD